MINSIKNFIHTFSILSSLRYETKVRIGDLNLSSSAGDGVYGDACPFTIDSENKVCDGNHRIFKILQEKGPDHEIEVIKYKYTQTFALLAIGVNSFILWTNEKWQSMKKEIEKDFNDKST